MLFGRTGSQVCGDVQRVSIPVQSVKQPDVSQLKLPQVTGDGGPHTPLPLQVCAGVKVPEVVLQAAAAQPVPAAACAQAPPAQIPVLPHVAPAGQSANDIPSRSCVQVPVPPLLHELQAEHDAVEQHLKSTQLPLPQSVPTAQIPPRGRPLHWPVTVLHFLPPAQSPSVKHADRQAVPLHTRLLAQVPIPAGLQAPLPSHIVASTKVVLVGQDAAPQLVPATMFAHAPVLQSPV